MELRRALLLFAIVLGVAAIASSITRPRGGDDDGAPSTDTAGRTPPARPAPAARSTRPTRIELRACKRQTCELQLGQPVTVVVDVDVPGQVDIPSLGLTEPAQPLTPATFDLLPGEAGRHDVTLAPAGSDAAPTEVGTLKVVRGS